MSGNNHFKNYNQFPNLNLIIHHFCLKKIIYACMYVPLEDKSKGWDDDGGKDVMAVDEEDVVAAEMMFIPA